MMDWERALVDLEELLERLGIELRREALPGQGGLCEVRGKKMLFVSRMLPPGEQVELMVQALRGLDLSGVYLRPALRELLGDGDQDDEADAMGSQ
jgi:hypothetical protein